MARFTRRMALALAVAAVALTGCGADDVREQAEQVREDVEERIREAREEYEERRERYGRRIREVLDDLDKVFEQPERTSPRVRSTRRATSSPGTSRRRRTPRWPWATSTSATPSTTGRRTSGGARSSPGSRAATRPPARDSCRRCS